ncbi:uncharacterized protein LOC134237456 [Saccostrea cucullata]|uniref:uncharacterized protein LOC134237456 n=1 Tax=Saccostrea cuccullata TaxID=36930 RepID=UPI002ED54352
MCPADLTGVTCGEVVTDTGCGGVIDLSSGENRTIQSPNYPSTVPVDRECVWLIKGPANSNVRLTIQELDLARNSNDLSCYHWLEIRYNFPGQTGIRQCNTQSANRQITTTNDGDRNIMILKFDSKFSKDVRPSQNQRFSLQVTAVGGTLVSNPCNPNPCQNSGTCSVSGSTYECTCTSGWSGTNCDVEMQSCQPNPCQNGGTCSIVGNSITCNCPQPFTGPNCEDSFISDPCNPNPCQNFGSCRAIGSTYQCTCRTGWSGTNCNIRAQSCQPNTCLNGGTCSVVGTSTRCSCPPSFTGPICENSLISNPCNPNPCQNFGTCRAIGSTYQCTCRVGWSGTNCNISAQSCQPNTCLNGGTCSVVGTSTRCSCPPRFTGPNCETFASASTSFHLPSGFYWFPWEMFKQVDQWQPNLINSWDRVTQDTPIANLLQTMIFYDDQGRPHKPLGINPAAKESVKVAAADHHYIPQARKRNFLQNALLWENNIVPYEIQTGFSGKMQQAIQEAFNIFHELTCVQFVPRAQATGLSHQGMSVVTIKIKVLVVYSMWMNQGCSSLVGRDYRNTRQEVNLQEPMCTSTKTVVHELMHAIGQMHEQSRQDRDRYIEVFFSNIQQGAENNFENNLPTHDRTPYDVESIMQYALTAASINGLPTMKLKDSRLESLVDSAQSLTHNDVKEITLAYSCAANCQNPPSCQNSGFVAHTCQCMCPADLTGSTCEQVDTDSDCGGIIDLAAGQEHNIKSPNYPNTYSVDKECVWMIRGPTNSNIKLTIQELNLARNTQTSACYHWLEIRYNLLGQTGIKQCNTPANQVLEYTTTDDGNKNIMILKFDSRLSRDQQPSQSQRFELKVQAISGSTNPTNPCSPNPCQNSGTCSVSGSSYTCTCSSGWSGTNCEIASQSCQPNPCQNGGTCQLSGGSIICSCTSQYTGPNCEQTTQLCDPTFCQNGGTCQVYGGYTYCICPHPFYGPNCQSFASASTSFHLPSGFYWYPWEMFKQVDQWQPNLINSWPLGINPAAKDSVKVAAVDHHVIPQAGGSFGRKKRNFLKSAVLWENNIVPYEIQSGFSPKMQQYIQDAFKIFHDLTCLKFVPRAQATGLSHNTYLFLSRGRGCLSYIGRVTYMTSQEVSLDEPSCTKTQTVVHELMHAVGQMHEQSRQDRDKYIEVFFSNLAQGQEDNFVNDKPTYDRTPYDVESIMQYPLTAGASSPGLRTMKLKDSRLESLVDTAQTLTHNDVKEITIAYSCAANCQNPPSCQNSGFVAHTCQCMCPADLTGSTCEQVDTDSDCGGIIDLAAGQEHNIKSPNYPNTYSVDKECVWMIRGPTNSNIKLTIQELNLARNTQTSACYHWLEIRYNLLGQTGIKQCNTPANQVLEYTTTDDGNKNIMILKFDSRLSRDQQPSQNQRFELKVQAISGSTNPTNPCSPNPCQNSGTCSVSGSSYTCTCPSGWSGTNCEIASQSCQPNPCQNGGTCQLSGGSIICSCTSQYTGPNCEQTTQLCDPTYCQNGGTCQVFGGSSYCICPNPYYGQNCQYSYFGGR